MINSLDFTLLTCPSCRHTGMVVHAYYMRDVRTDESIFRLKVVRVRCSSCGRTHAVLPDLLIPYSSIPLDVTILIIEADNADEINEILDDFPSLDLADAYRIRKNYRRHWKERLKSFGLIIDDWISRRCLHLFQMQFMQIRPLCCGYYE